MLKKLEGPKIMSHLLAMFFKSIYNLEIKTILIQFPEAGFFDFILFSSLFSQVFTSDGSFHSYYSKVFTLEGFMNINRFD